MKVITSERVSIKMWLDDLEQGALDQAKNLANLPFIHKWVAIMPDSHQGYGMPIGGVIATDNVVIPNAVGVDIGCGMCAMKTGINNISTSGLKDLMGKVRQQIPVGFNHHKEAQPHQLFDSAPDIPIIQSELNSARKQLGTLGGGNHFVEFQEDEELNLWIMIHSGSRNFGLKTAKHYHKAAQALCEKWHVNLPDSELAYLPLEDSLGQEYLKAMSYCCQFAQSNRAQMMIAVASNLWDTPDYGKEGLFMDCRHNYATMEHHYGKDVLVHRKGAIRARVGDVGIIPGSMGSASYIVEGLGNKESFTSCSHGAGRKMGRKEASKALVLEEEQAKMEGIVHGLRNASDLDEAPGAYKDIDQVMENQRDLVRITTKLKPIGSIKG